MRMKREKTKPTLLWRALACLVCAAMIVAFTPVVAWGAETTVGDFTVTGGTLGTDYTYSDNTLTITQNGTFSISGTTTTDRIVVASGVNASITLNNVNIDVSGVHVSDLYGVCAFEISSGAYVTLTLTGENTLKSGKKKAALQVETPQRSGAMSGVLIIKGNGSLLASCVGGGAGIGGSHGNSAGNIIIESGRITASGTNGGAGIGGGDYGSCGIISIRGGTIMATGAFDAGSGGAGIGGGYECSASKGDKITISGGTVTATSTDGAGIGGGLDGTVDNITISGGTVEAVSRDNDAGIRGDTVTISGGTVMATGYIREGISGTFKTQKDNATRKGDAVIFATTFSKSTSVKAISDQSGKTSGLWSGVIFEKDSGFVYGSPTLKIDLTIPDGKTLTVPSGSSLTIAMTKTLTVSSGSTLINEGSIYVGETGTLSGEVNNTGMGAVYYPLKFRDPSYYTIEKDNVSLNMGYYGKAGGTITLSPKSYEGYSVSLSVKDSSRNPIAVTDNKFVMPSEAVTVYASKTLILYTISYNLDGGQLAEGSENPTEYNVNSEAITLVNPTKTGYTFTGWSGTDVTGEPTKSVTIKKGSIGERSYTAHWQINQYTIMFDLDGGTGTTTITQDFGTAVTAPENPTKTGYTFKSWDKEVPATMPAENVTITATWDLNNYTISFVTNGGTEVAPIEKSYGTTINAPTAPTKTGYTFAGWYKDASLTNPYSFGTMPAESITLYAKWLSQDTSVKTVAVKGVDATVDNASRTVEVTLPYNVALPTQDSDFVIEPAQGAEVTTPPVKEGDVWKFTVTAEDGKTKATYTVSVNVRKETVLRLQSTASKTSIKLKWNEVPEADGYVIYWSKCGSKNSFKPIKVIESGKTLTWIHKNLKKGSWNRYYVKAYKVIDGKKSYIKTSNKIHLTTKGGKYTNVKKLKASISSLTLKKGKTKALKIKQTYAEKNKKPTLHMRPLIYTTSDKTVATVTSKGVIKAKGTGSCYIYITAYSGVYTRVKVTVK